MKIIISFLLASIMILAIQNQAMAQDSFLDENGKLTISGTIVDKESGEELIGATVYIQQLKTGTITNAYGFYSLTLFPGDYTITIGYLSYQSVTETIQLTQNIKRNYQLIPSDSELAEIEVVAEKRNKNVVDVEMGVEKLQMKTVQRIPALFGEADLIKSIQLMPGVNMSGEGFIGYNVRGGGAGQNLMLLDEATVYNAAHLLGIFSVFNNDAIKDVTLYKGGIPAEYGGRLSSLLDVRMKDGNINKFSGSGGIGLLSSRLTLETPIVKDKSSLILAGRRSYMDLFFPMFKKMPDKTSMHFYDLNAKFNYKFNDKNRIYLSGYFGRDAMDFQDVYVMEYGNKTLTLRYNHLFSDKLFSNLSVIYSDFDYLMGEQGANLTSSIVDFSVKNDYSYFINPNNTLKFGVAATHHRFTPYSIDADGSLVYVLPENITRDNTSIEYAAYLSHELKIANKLTVDYGLRFSAFQNYGDDNVYTYNDDYEIIDTTSYKKGEFYNTYKGWEPRVAANYLINSSSSLKFSYHHTYQYVHLASNTMSPLPIDTWLASNPNIKPESCNQISLGFFKNFSNNTYLTSIESYYKNINNTVDFKDHANVMLTTHVEDQIRSGNGYSYGLEFQLKKQTGDFTGWLSYTYSRTFVSIDGINNNEKYPSNYDKPHDISVVLSYQLAPRVNVSTNWVYSTGAPRTLPTGRFEYNGIIAPVYTSRNSERLPDYHRLDLAVTYDFKDSKRNGKKRFMDQNINFSIYNAYNRHNAASIMFNQDKDNPLIVKAEKLYLFSIMPSITYNFKF